LIAIITDGEENASSHYTLDRVRELITRRQKACGWSFIAIAPNAASLAFKGSSGEGRVRSEAFQMDAKTH
jgi:hypothetical protein